MKIKKIGGWLLASLGSMSLWGTAALAAEPADAPVLRMLTIQTSDLKTYAHELSIEEAMLRKVGVSCNFHVWQAAYAGSEAGTIFVQLEFPSFAMFARYLNAGEGHPDLAAQMGKFNPQLRKITSDSILREVPAN